MAKTHYCFLEKFNNYFNRKVIRFETLTDYESAAANYHIPLNSDTTSPAPFNFNPNDNVMTEIIANDLSFSPDYFLLLDSELNILSRWFVMEEKRNRNGQWLYTLRRDVVADNLQQLMNSPVFVHRAMLDDSDPFVLNDEGMRLNQIKKSELLLKDQSETAWVVGYIAKNTTDKTIQIQDTVSNVSDAVSLNDVVEALGATNRLITVDKFVALLNIGETALENVKTNVMTRFSFNFYARRTIGGIFTYVTTRLGLNYPYKTRYWAEQPLDPMTPASQFLVMTRNETGDYSDFLSEFANALRDSEDLWDEMETIIDQPYVLTTADIDLLKGQFDGVPIYYNGKYYQLKIKSAGTNQLKPRVKFDIDNYPALADCLDTACANSDYERYVGTEGIVQTIFVNNNEYYLQLVEMNDATSLVPTMETAISSGRNVCLDQPYDMICIPYGAINVYFDGFVNPNRDNTGAGSFETLNIAREIISKIAQELDASCYDVQLLPYCPVVNDYFDNYRTSPALPYKKCINLNKLTEHKEFEYIWKKTDTTVRAHIARNEYDLIADPLDPTKFKLDASFEIDDVMNAFPDYYVSGSIINDPEENPDLYDDIPDLTVTMSYDKIQNKLTITAISGTIPTGKTVDQVKLNLYFEYIESQYPISIMFYPRYASFSNFIDEKLEDAEEPKVESNCSFYRLVSPNYQGSFEFNLAKNGGSVESFTAYCTCKPYSPFVKVAPQFSYLYGIDFNDARGMISSGDFSMARTQSKWEEFELNNKNYQNIFNRDIQSLDFTATLDYRNATIAGGLGVFTDTIKGGAAGGFVGATAGPVGAVAGAVIGGTLAGVSSGMGMNVDLDTMLKKYQEARSLSIDKYNYTLGNIRALPYTITKIGAFDVSSKIFPFVEFYTCTDMEKEAFRNKIKYESMTVMRIGTFGEFYRKNDEIHFFKGELIMNEDIADDPHIFDAIYAELMKGVRM